MWVGSQDQAMAVCRMLCEALFKVLCAHLMQVIRYLLTPKNHVIVGGA
jgi:hypothetical protein